MEEGKGPAFAERAKDFTNTWNEELSKVADTVKFLVVECGADVAVSLGNDYQGARVRRDRVSEEASSTAVIENDVALFDENSVVVWSESHKWLAGRGGNFER